MSDANDPDVDDDDGAGSSRPVARAVAIGATARRDADRRGFLARIVARVVAANEQGADVIPPRTHSRVSTGLGEFAPGQRVLLKLNTARPRSRSRAHSHFAPRHVGARKTADEAQTPKAERRRAAVSQ